MRAPTHRYPRHGTVGLLLLLLMTTALFASLTNLAPVVPWWRITAWATPVCWWGYILVVDAWIYLRQGQSVILSRPRLLVLQAILSVAFWVLFEGYNRLLPGWQYLNLEPHLSVRFLGYTLAFATIMPGMFFTCELLQSYGLFAGRSLRPVRWTPFALRVSVVLGALCCFVPPFLPAAWRGYFWAPVWVGWILLLEPFNYRRGAQSLFRDWEQGNLARTLQLMLAGGICGLLWEFWNMWAFTKWVYIFPLPFGLPSHYFEMPVIGFLGFLPFALEFFVLFHFLASFFTREDVLGL
ncbi:hypothetical protein HQ590_10630 [bacterium]|nr:hypothetical protein [bacterium]